jgi:hypothetical protein
MNPLSAPGTGIPAASADPRSLPPGNFNNPRAVPISSPLPIAGTPRPTSTLAVNSNARPAVASSNNTPLDYRSPHPVDDAAQPVRPPSSPNTYGPASAPTTNSARISNRYGSNAVAATQPGMAGTPVAQPRQMPMAPTAYGNSLAAPPYRAAIQTRVVEPDWQPCDDYADDGE